MTGTETTRCSVIVPSHERPTLLMHTVALILGQRAVDVEVIVVDDGSTIPISPAGALGDPRVRILRHTESRGVAAARNTGLAAAGADWVAFTDDDDLWAPEKLASQLAAIAGVPGARWSCVGAVMIDDDFEIIGQQRPPASGDVSDLILAKNAIPGGGSAVVADTGLVRSLGGFDETLSNSADYDMWVRLALAAPLAAVDRPLIAYRVHSGGMSRQLDRIYDEVTSVRAKHAAERERRGVVSASSIHAWIGDRHQRSGRRRPAARSYLRAAPALGRVNATARAFEALVWPGAYRFRDRRRRAQISPQWRAEIDSWLPSALDRGAGPITGTPGSRASRTDRWSA